MRSGRRLAVAVIVMLDSLQAAADTPLAIHIHSERAMFQVLVSPGTVGTDSFVLQLMSGEGNLLPVKEATLVLTLPARGIEPLARKATLGADRYWQILLQKSFWGDERNFSGPLMRSARGDVRAHIILHKNDHGPSYRP